MYKVIIVGAGPGGALLARELAGKGIEVHIYEQNVYEELGHDWSDAVELIALGAAGFAMPKLSGKGNEWEGELVKTGGNQETGLFEKHAVPELQIRSPGLASNKKAAFHMITTDRRRLGQALVDQALQAGALVHYRHEGRGLLYNDLGRDGPGGVEVYGVRIRNLETGEDLEIKADMVVESSGFQAVLRSSLPRSSGLADAFVAGDFALVHREVRLYEPRSPGAEEIIDHYRYGFHSGYQWTHIHNEERIDVGAGVKHDAGNPDPRDIIEEFIVRHPAIKTQKFRGGRSLCIVGPPLDNFVAGGFLVIGDAASTSVPTTGCGAGSALLSALVAAEVIAEAAAEQRNDLEKLWAINAGFYLESERGASFAALSALRQVLQTLSHDELDFLFLKDLLDAETLQNAVNGIFRPPGAGRMVKAVGALGKFPLLIRLNSAVSTATKIYRHYRNYPERWDYAAYMSWRRRAEELQASE